MSLIYGLGFEPQVVDKARGLGMQGGKFLLSVGVIYYEGLRSVKGTIDHKMCSWIWVLG